MSILLAHFKSNGKEEFITQEKGGIRKESENKGFKNLELIENRNEFIVDVFNGGKIEGDGVFDFRYGPVSGIGEAGVFHLYTYGERILSVKIDTFYKRRKLDEKMIGMDVNDALKIAERVSGNFSVSHSLAFSRAIEKAMKVEVDDKTKRVRAIALELERIYNHIHVISKLASDAAQLVLASHLSELFEDSLCVNEIFSGSRYLRDFVTLGGVTKVPSDKALNSVLKEIEKNKKSFTKLYKNSMTSRNYIDRLHSTAILSARDAAMIGLTGPSLRACNVKEDLRIKDDIYKDLKIVTDEEGDALSRMEVRAKEILESMEFVENNVKKINSKETDRMTLQGKGDGLGWCESPSGAIIYSIGVEDSKIKVLHVSTPSVFGMAAMAHSIVGNIFTDFPFALDSFGVNFADAAR